MGFNVPTGYTSQGYFTHADTDVRFDYEPAMDDERRGLFQIDNDFNVRILFTNGETRLAKVIQTRAYVIVDEDENGNPVIERWHIKRHTVLRIQPDDELDDTRLAKALGQGVKTRTFADAVVDGAAAGLHGYAHTETLHGGEPKQPVKISKNRPAIK